MSYPSARWLIGLVLIIGAATGSNAAERVVSTRTDRYFDHGVVASRFVKAPKDLVLSLSVPSGAKTADGRLIITHSFAMRHVGGIVFDGVAAPNPSFLTLCPDIGVDPGKIDGRRLWIKYSDQMWAWSSGYYDWIITPVFDFVADIGGGPVAFTYMGLHAQYHTAFSNNLAGLNLAFTDTFNMINDFAHVQKVIGDDSIPGYHLSSDTAEYAQASIEAVSKIRSEMSSVANLTQIMFVDADTKYSFGITFTKRLVFHGDPYWVLMTKNQDGSGNIEKRIDDTSLLLRANPIVFGNSIKIARLAAFFRYMKRDCNVQWRDFAERFNNVRREMDNIKIDEGDMMYMVFR